MISSENLGDYTVFEYDFELSNVRLFPIEAGRGCPFGCTFCSTSMFWGRKFRIKPIEQLLNEMKKLNRLHGITSFSLEHDMFTVNKKYLIDFCDRMINEKVGFTWGCSSRIDALDEQCMIKMKEAGCKSIYIGIETGSPVLQKVVNKNLELHDAVEKILLLKRYGFDLTVSFIYGFPDETEEDFRYTMNMIQKLLIADISNVQLHLFIPLPNTQETKKISDRVYFDPSQIELSVYNENKFSNKLRQMVLDYKDVFIQYYTFDSYIRTEYVRVDFLLNSFVSAKSVYKYSVNYVLKKVSLLEIYKNSIELIEKTNREANEIPVSEGFDGSLRFKLLVNMVAEIIEKYIQITDDIYVIEVFRVEKIITEYKLEERSDTMILHSKYNIFKLMEQGEIEIADTYVSLTKTKTGVTIKTIRVTEEIKKMLV